MRVSRLRLRRRPTLALPSERARDRIGRRPHSGQRFDGFGGNDGRRCVLPAAA